MSKKQQMNVPPKKGWRTAEGRMRIPAPSRASAMMTGKAATVPALQHQFVMRGGRKILPPTEEGSMLINVMRAKQESTSKRAELSHEKIDEIRAAAIIGFEQAVSDVAAIRAEIFGMPDPDKASKRDIPSGDKPYHKEPEIV